MDAMVRELSYAQAIQEAMAIAMDMDERVFLMGEDIGVYGGAFQVTGDLVERFGTERVIDTPISELGGAGVAVGAAVTGMRPIFEFQFSDFATLAMEQIVNQAAKMRFMLGGEVSVPVVMRFPAGSGTGAAAGVPWYAILVLPLLFAAGMSLLDCLDGLFMSVAYDWAFLRPVRKVYYNLTITGLSIAVAVLIGGIELIAVLHDNAGWTNRFTDVVSSLDLNNVGFVVVGLFVVIWGAAIAYWNLARVEERWATSASVSPE